VPPQAAPSAGGTAPGASPGTQGAGDAAQAASSGSAAGRASGPGGQDAAGPSQNAGSGPAAGDGRGSASSGRRAAPVISSPLLAAPHAQRAAGYSAIPGSVMVPAPGEIAPGAPGAGQAPSPGSPPPGSTQQRGAAQPSASPQPPASARPAAPGQPATARLGAAGPLRPPPGSPAAPAAALRGYADALAAQRKLDAAAVLAVLQEARYDADVARLTAPPRGPAKIKRSWPRYRQRYVEPIRLRGGRAFMAEHASLLAAAEQRYGVPAEIVTAIIGVETVYGRQTGRFRVLDALATLAFNYPDPTRADRVQLFNDQLADFVELCLTTGMDARRALGSYAGAMGMPQFMPGSILRYAVDGDGDGRIDLGASVPDSIMSVANFLNGHGWRPGLPPFAPVALPADPSGLVQGGLEPHLDWAALRAAGASSLSPGPAAWQDAPLGVIDLPDEPNDRVEYRAATPNFFALTHYNRSYFYASAVADLAAELARRPGG